MTPIGSLWGDIAQRQTKVLPLPEFKSPDKPEGLVTKFPYGKIPAFEDGRCLKALRLHAIVLTLQTLSERNRKEGWARTQRKALSRISTRQACRVLDSRVNESHLATRLSGYVALNKLNLADHVLAGVILHARGCAVSQCLCQVFAHFVKVIEDERVKQFCGADR
ncbi:hypothetical protein V8E55_011903 [Tylopilus felleus]